MLKINGYPFFLICMKVSVCTSNDPAAKINDIRVKLLKGILGDGAFSCKTGKLWATWLP